MVAFCYLSANRILGETSMDDEQKSFQELLKSIESPNIAVIGKTGVGKSTLINAVFGIKVAKAGAGAPVTQDYTKYDPEFVGVKLPVVLFDSPGYEAGEEEEFVQKTFKFLSELNSQGVNKQIHLVWYVVSAPSARFEEFDARILNEINNHNIPAIIVLSQCEIASDEQREELKKVIAKASLSKVYDVIEVSASPLVINSQPICQPFGLKELVNKTIENLPKIYSEAVILAQTVDVESKRDIAWKYIQEASLASLGVGVIPIPITAPIATISSLSYLVKRLTTLYGYSELGMSVAMAGLTFSGVIAFGINAIADTFSFFGTSIITGAAAGTQTLLTGLAYARTCEKLAKEKVKGSQTDIQNFLKKTFKEEFQRLSKIGIKVSSVDDVSRIGRRYLDDNL
jgi:small GTP-binding protein